MRDASQNSLIKSERKVSVIDCRGTTNFVPQTVNDVITGIIFYGIKLYLQAAGQGTKPAKVTALVLLNTRAIKTYQPPKAMNRPNTKAPWGNHFAFLHVSVSTCSEPENAGPLDSIRRAKKIIKAKRNSLGIYLNAGVLELIRISKGTEVCCTVRLSIFKKSMIFFSFLLLFKKQFEILCSQNY